MAALIKRDNSRRRLAAVSFLSNISLDGTYKDTRLALLPRNGAITKAEPVVATVSGGDESDDCFSDNELVRNAQQKKIKTKPIHSDVHSLSSDSESVAPVKGYNDDKKERSGENIYEKRHGFNLRKRFGTQVSIGSENEKHQYGSSTESLTVLAGSRSKISPAPVIPENNYNDKPTIVENPKDYTFNDERLIMVTTKHLPFYVCSVIPYTKNNRPLRPEVKRDVIRKRNPSGPRPMSAVGDIPDPFDMFGIIDNPDGQEVSYGQLLIPTKPAKEFRERKCNSTDEILEMQRYNGKHHQVIARCFSYDQSSQKATAHVVASSPPPDRKTDDLSYTTYQPNLLDDPELIAGKHRTLLTFPSYIVSIIDYVKPSDLKKEINDKFKEKFPHIDLTLSKLRSLKKEMRKISKMEPAIHLLIVAQSYVYFEKLILRGLINKQNRKPCAAASLLLSAKLNDVKGETLRSLIERMENVFRLNRKELMTAEFAVLIALEFGLHVPNSEVTPHYKRLRES